MKTTLFARFRAIRAFRAAVLATVAFTVFEVYGAALLAQTFTHNTTTVATAQTATDTTLVLTAVTAATGSSFGAVQVGQQVLVDQELELVTAIASTTLTVQRRGRLTAHAAGAPVYIGPAGSFQHADPPAGACTTANQPKFWINIESTPLGPGPSAVFTCGANSVWARSNAPWYAGLNSGNGATVTLTAADSGKSFLFDRAAGIVYTLPAPYPGMTFDFVYTVTITSNAAVVVTAAGTQFVAGALHVLVSGAITGLDFACNGTSHIKISSNGTTSGGILGGHVRFTAATTTLWVVDGLLVGSGSTVTPCST